MNITLNAHHLKNSLDSFTSDIGISSAEPIVDLPKLPVSFLTMGLVAGAIVGIGGFALGANLDSSTIMSLSGAVGSTIAFAGGMINEMGNIYTEQNRIERERREKKFGIKNTDEQTNDFSSISKDDATQNISSLREKFTSTNNNSKSHKI